MSCFGVLIFFSSIALWSSPLPNDIHIKTLEQSFSPELDYALRDGKLWVTPHGGYAEWALFQGTGVPFGKKIKSFKPQDKLSEFSTEGLIVVARSNTGRIYMWDPTKKDQPDAWYEKLGSPFEEELRLPPNRDWAFSVSLTVAPWKRRTPMQEIDSYYEDAIGNKIVFGFTATIYTLDPDGQRIRYWDTGLPASFHKAIATPERGRFVAEKLSTAGSTLFVIDQSGKMYTRLFDYETFGACPGLRSTFDPIKHDPVVGPEDIPLYAAVRVVPMPSWEEQKFDASLLGNQGELTRNITIRITGEGNAARELRIQGRNRNGEYGYFHKALTAKEWSFTLTDDRYEQSAAIMNLGGARALGFPQDKDYKGAVKQAGSRDIGVELVRFNYFDSPATLRVTLPSGRPIDLALHTFDAWGPTVQQKGKAELVGTVVGEPKLLLGTLEIPRQILDSTDPETKQVIDAYFRRFHLVHLAFSIQADDGRVEMFTRKIKRNSPAYMDFSSPKQIKLSFDRAVSQEELIHRGIVPLDQMVEANALLYSGQHSELDALIRRNEALIVELNGVRRKQKWNHLKQGLVAGLGMAVFTPVNWFVSLTGIAGKSPLWGNLSMVGRGQFKDYAVMNLKAVFTDRAGYGQAIQTLKTRVRQYKRLRCERHLL